ncbi:MAG: DUF6473 family protein [Roseobacter sp.]
MIYEQLGPRALNYAPCKYSNSRLLFRGPERRLDAPYVAFIGGTETYGKFINAPYPSLVESNLGVNCINLGIVNAGVDVFLDDGFLTDAANGAEAVVIQIVGAQNISNRFYTVHPRRNDRFLKASPLLQSIYPEVDFADFHFTRHMLSMLRHVSEQRFNVVVSELQEAWTARMKMLLRRVYRDTILVWVADREPLEAHDPLPDPVTSGHPLFVSRKMLDDLRRHASDIVLVRASEEAVKAGTTGMIFDEDSASVAQHLLGPKAHGEIAMQLGKALTAYAK